MSSDTKLPSIEDIEKLWYEQQREMVESGRVVKFNRTVFWPMVSLWKWKLCVWVPTILLADGMYLEYNPEVWVSV